MMFVNSERVVLVLLAVAAVQLCSCDGPAVRVPVRETPREQEPDAGDATCDDSAVCTDPERPLCSSEGECVQCIEDGDCPQGECEHGRCEEDDEERDGGE